MDVAWGKCRVLYRLAGSLATVAWTEMPTPVEDSTQLNTTQGDKTEAKVEGGENEAVKYKRNTYQLVFNVRGATDRKVITHKDGVVTPKYEWLVIPEDTNAIALYIQTSTVNVQDSFNTADGAIWAYAVDALKVETKKANLNTNQIHWGKVTIAESTEGDITTCTAISFQELSDGSLGTSEVLYTPSL